MSRIIFSKKSLSSSIEGDIKVNSKATADTYSLTTIDHDKLKNRDLPDQHPVEAISGLKELVDGIEAEVDQAITDVENALSNIEEIAEQAQEAVEQLETVKDHIDELETRIVILEQAVLTGSTPTPPSIYEYLVSIGFIETGTGAGNYRVSFNLKSSNNYNPANITFTQLRNMIIANGNNVACRYTGRGTAHPQYVTTSTNAGDDTILVQYTDSNYFEFVGYAELENIEIKKLNY